MRSVYIIATFVIFCAVLSTCLSKVTNLSALALFFSLLIAALVALGLYLLSLLAIGVTAFKSFPGEATELKKELDIARSELRSGGIAS